MQSTAQIGERHLCFVYSLSCCCCCCYLQQSGDLLPSASVQIKSGFAWSQTAIDLIQPSLSLCADAPWIGSVCIGPGFPQTEPSKYSAMSWLSLCYINMQEFNFIYARSIPFLYSIHWVDLCTVSFKWVRGKKKKKFGNSS